MARRGLLDTVSTIIVTCAALLMTAFYVLDRRPSPPAEAPAPRVIEGWQAYNDEGIRVGSLDAPVVITEFIDFECPYCKQLVPRVDSVISEFQDQVSLVIHHWPLEQHQFARPAAIAAECAQRQGRFIEMYRLLFEQQDSFGVKPWHAYAIDAHIPDLTAFDDCIALPADSFPRIARGLAIGQKEGVRGTPTLWINGRAIGRTDFASIHALVDDLAGR